MGIIQHVKEEFQVIKERDPAIKSPMEVLLYPSFRVMLSYRRAHKLYLKGALFLGKISFPACGEKNRDRDTSGCNDRKRIFHRSWKRCYHRRDRDRR